MKHYPAGQSRFRGLLGSASFTRLVGVLAASLAAAPSHAGTSAPGVITFGANGANPVPALGSAMVLLLALLLAFMAAVALKRRAGVLPAIGALLATGTLLGTLGVPVIERAVGAGMTFLISNPAGQTAPITPNDVSTYSNTSGIPLRVISVSLPGACGPESIAINDPFECGVGTTVAAGGSCSVDCATPAQISDLRLKQDVVRVGNTHQGLPLYRFSYIGDSAVYEGVMAQDVITRFPDAVIQREDGYMAVIYGALGLQMRRIAE